MNVKTVGITRKTGHKVATALESWMTPNGTELVEHLAGVDEQGHLIVFWWSPSTDWRVTDVTEQVGRRFARVKPVAWQTENGRQNVEHLALPDEEGHLIVCWWVPQVSWRSFDISGHTGRSVHSGTSIASVTHRETGQLSEYLYAAGPNRELIEFRFRPSTDWRARLVLREDGETIRIQPETIAAWKKKVPSTTFSVVALSVNGELTEHMRTEHGPWSSEVVPSHFKRFLIGPTVAWQTETVEHLAAVTRAHELVLYWRPSRGSPGGWREASPSAETNQRVDKVASAYLMSAAEAGSEHATQCLTAVGGGHAYRFWWNPKHWWQVLDVTEATGIRAEVPAEGWAAPDGRRHVEHVAAVSEGNLTVCWGLSESRRLTEELADSK